MVATNDANDVVYGVLYEIPMSEKDALDTAEGVGRGYETKEVEVAFNGAPHEATVYYATDIDPSLGPTPGIRRSSSREPGNTDSPPATLTG